MVHMTIENRWRVHIVAGGDHSRTRTTVSIVLLLLRPYTRDVATKFRLGGGGEDSGWGDGFR